VPLFLQTSLGGGVGRLKPEALREEVHRFDRLDHTPAVAVSYRLCCTAAMQEIQIGKIHHETRTNRSSDREPDAKTPALSAGVEQSLRR
jgi:hypothetical protein